jgi:hypothetical protein
VSPEALSVIKNSRKCDLGDGWGGERNGPRNTAGLVVGWSEEGGERSGDASSGEGGSALEKMALFKRRRTRRGW